MMKICAAISLFMFLQIKSFAQAVTGFNYSISSINDSLKKNTNAVYRLDETILEMSDPSGYLLKTHQVISILNPEGAAYLHLKQYTDKNNRLTDVEIKVYDQSGNEVKRYRKKDFETRSAYDGFSVAQDDKIMYFDVPAPSYPCSVDIQETENFSSYIIFPTEYMSTNTENFRYVVKVPATFNLHYKAYNIIADPHLENDGKTKTYTWELKNTICNGIESDGYDANNFIPQIHVVPDFFVYDGYKGSLKTWKEYGEWTYSLYQEKNPFSADRVAEIKSMIASCQTTREKINILYTYVQKNTRYVSIQLGIGGFKPFPAKFVDENKYGDCKALTNYMRYLLDVAGIKSYPAVINAGYRSAPADPNFPTDPFNHVILCVPLAKDTVWLECTGKSNKAGFLGSFTEDRYALLITENGGVLVKTPESNLQNTRQISHTDIYINTDETATTESHIYATGDIFELFDEISKYDDNRKKEFFVNYAHYNPSETFVLKDHSDTASGGVYNIEESFDKAYDFKAGNKYFFPQRVYELCENHLNVSQSRKLEYVFQYPYIKSDTTILHFPDGFSVDNIPEPVEWSNEFCSFKRTIQVQDNDKTIKTIATLQLKKRIIPANDYQKIADFFAQVIKDEDQKIVMKKGG